MGGGADSQTFGDISNHYFSAQKFPNVVGGAVKTQNQIQILGEIYGGVEK